MVTLPKFKRLPRHIAVIPDGNRRWAQAHGMGKEAGYAYGIEPGLALCDLCIALGIAEVSAYGFTNDNTRRPADQRKAFQQAIIDGITAWTTRDVAFLIVGNTESAMFPPELLPLTTRRVFGTGALRANLLVNYDWQWDISQAMRAENAGRSRKTLLESIGSADVSRVDLVIRWGGRRRLSGMLPVQSVYADIYVVDDHWPDFKPEHLFDALRWYEEQDITLGG